MSDFTSRLNKVHVSVSTLGTEKATQRYEGYWICEKLAKKQLTQEVNELNTRWRLGNMWSNLDVTARIFTWCQQWCTPHAKNIAYVVYAGPGKECDITRNAYTNQKSSENVGGCLGGIREQLERVTPNQKSKAIEKANQGSYRGLYNITDGWIEGPQANCTWECGEG